MESLPDKVAFLGVGGAGMAPLAIFLRSKGVRVVGWDNQIQPFVERLLIDAGVELPLVPPEEEFFSLTVISSAVSRDHPYLKILCRDGTCEVLRRGEFLSRLARGYKVIAVAGSHGKSTTTALLIDQFIKTDFPINYICGAFFQKQAYLPAESNDSEYLLLELDESDGTISGFSPEITLFTCWDWDHADFYPKAEGLKQAFTGLFQRTRGKVILHSRERGLFPEISDDQFLMTGDGGQLSFATLQGNGRGSQSSLRLRLPDDGEHSVSLKTIGKFNQDNALLCFAAAFLLTGDSFRPALENFPGLLRRQEILWENEEKCILSDYAHHPNELRVLFESLSDQTGPGSARPLWVVFQPHRYSRTERFIDDFAAVLKLPSKLFLIDVYGAGEQTPNTKSFETLCERVARERGEQITVLTLDSAGLESLYSQLPDQVDLLFAGAGNLDRLALALRSRLASGQEDPSAAWKLFMDNEISSEGKVALTEPLANKTTLRVGGKAAFYAEPASPTDLALALESAKFFQLPIHFLGRGSNLIVPDEGVDGLVIRLHHRFWRSLVPLSRKRLWAAGGVRLKELCGVAAKTGLSGFEGFEGIPGSVGGSLRMNAGAMGSWLFDVVESVLLMTPDGKLQFLPKESFHVVYRECSELRQSIGLGAVFISSEAKATEEIQNTMVTFATQRKKSQPKGPSAGCIFKNPPGSAAGLLIDRAGLKGCRVGAAVVSDIHGNFIINEGGATASEVFDLIHKIQAEVKGQTGIELEREVQVFGKEAMVL